MLELAKCYTTIGLDEDAGDLRARAARVLHGQGQGGAAKAQIETVLEWLPEHTGGAGGARRD